jgi:hypothetical protein
MSDIFSHFLWRKRRLKKAFSPRGYFSLFSQTEKHTMKECDTKKLKKGTYVSFLGEDVYSFFWPHSSLSWALMCLFPF